MEREISQPDIPRPKLHGTENHAALFATRQSWVRHVAPQLGIDEHKQILGETLHKIVGDDSNLFTWASDVYFPAEVAKDAKTGLGIRLVNEISTPEIISEPDSADSPQAEPTPAPEIIPAPEITPPIPPEQSSDVESSVLDLPAPTDGGEQIGTTPTPAPIPETTPPIPSEPTPEIVPTPAPEPITASSGTPPEAVAPTPAPDTIPESTL